MRRRGRPTFCTLLATSLLLHFALQEISALGYGDGTTKRCYGELGCFSINGVFYDPVYRPLKLFPQERHVVNTEFLLYTRQNPVQEDFFLWNSSLKQIGRSHFNASRPTKIINNIFLGAWLKKVKSAFLQVGDYNVIIVDWRGGNGLPYMQAAVNTRLVGAEITVFVKKLQVIYGIQTV